MEFRAERVPANAEWLDIDGELWLGDPPSENLLDEKLSREGKRKAGAFLRADEKERVNLGVALQDQDDLFLAFGRLEGSPDSVLRFAKRYGRLGVTEELPEAQLLRGGVWVSSGESLETWREAIKVMRIAIRFWRADAADADPLEKKEARAEIKALASRELSRGKDEATASKRQGESDEQDKGLLFHPLHAQLKKKRDREEDAASADEDTRREGELFPSFPIAIPLRHLTLKDGTSWFLHPGKNGIASRRTRAAVLEALTDQFASHLIELRLTFVGEEYDLAMRPRTLWGLLWAQFMLATASSTRYYRCVECKNMFRQEDKGRSTRLFCGKKCSQRDYRKRMRAAEDLWNQSTSPQEITAVLNGRSGRKATTLEQVQKWIDEDFQ